MHGWFGLTSIAAISAVLTGIMAQMADGPFSTTSPIAAALNTFCYWTVDTNILVAIAAAAIAYPSDRTSRWLPELLPTALSGIALTGLVFNTMMRDDRGHGVRALHSDLAHIAVPAMMIGGWLLFMPRPTLRWRGLLWAFAFGMSWSVATFWRGMVSGYYPYNFINAEALGYVATFLNTMEFTTVYLAVGSFCIALQKIKIHFICRHGGEP